MERRQLKAAGSVVLDASGAGTVSLGPDTGPGPATWNVTGVIILTSRPGAAPIPRALVYLDATDYTGVEGVTYDGSFSQGTADITMSRGQKLTATWSGGQVGDIASMTVSGEKW